jgi:hypothetical protein
MYSEDIIKELDPNRRVIQDLYSFDTIEKIIGWVQDSPVDWVNPIMGPRTYVNLDKEKYNRVRNTWQEVKKYKEGLILAKVEFERSYECSDSFREKLEKYVEKNFGYIVDVESW